MAMRGNPVQFAVVREDPLVELTVLERWPCRRALMVASGGCTVLTVAARCPALQITALDPNPAQLALVARKRHALLAGEAVFNVEDTDPGGLSECGNFESLFRNLRHFLHEHVATDTEIEAVLEGRLETSLLTEAPYWPVAFRLFFSDAYLVAMFGPDAVQYAEQGSYPDYFRRRFERGLAREDRAENPFLHHLLLGRYRAHALPELLRQPPGEVTLTEGLLQDQSFAAYDFVDLSNVLDWMGPSDVDALLDRLAETAPGTVVLWRQLNNARPLHVRLQEHFTFDADLEARLHARDRSLFYERLHIGRRRHPSRT